MQALVNPKLFNKNSFEDPENIVPEEKEIELNENKMAMELPAYSLQVLKIKMN